jgi:Fe-S cluster assembly protein SufD
VSGGLLELHRATFARERESLRRAAPWFAPLRESAAALAALSGLPAAKAEEWRFTNLRALSASALEPLDALAPPPARAAANALDALAAFRLVFVDGWLQSEADASQRLPEGLFVADLRTALADEHELLAPYLNRLCGAQPDWFAAMNTALFRGGCVVRVAPGARIELPVHLRFWQSERIGSVQPRLLVLLAENSDLTLIEEHRAPGSGLCNLVVEANLAAGAKLTHVKLVHASRHASHIATWHVELGAAAQLAAHSLAIGGELLRNEIELRLRGEKASAELDGLVLADGDSVVDHHTRILHQVRQTTSRQQFRHVLDGHAHGIFAGRVRVEPDAQKTDAQQENRNLLLSDAARMNTMPQLEIHADDVRCSHGATLGRLDENALFYMRTRGIGEAEARQLLVHAFASAMVERLPLPELRTEMREHLFAKISHDPLLKEMA